MSRMIKSSVIALSCVALMGCTEGLIKNDGTRTRAEGAGIGAALGAGVGAAFGGKRGAIIGAGVGLVGGALVGDRVAKIKQGYANTEDALTHQTAEVRSQTAQLRQSNAQLSQKIRTLHYQINQLKAQINQGRQVQAQLKQRIAILGRERDAAKRKLAQVEEEFQTRAAVLKSYEADASRSNPQGLARWQAEVAALEQEKVKLQRNLDNLNNMSNAVGLS